MNRITGALCSLLLLYGCTPVKNTLSLPEAKTADLSFLSDQTKPDNYPAFMSGQGNIYTCRYGIHFQSAGEFEPAKGRIFGTVLAKYIPDISAHRVVLTRFDIYDNHRLRSLAKVGEMEGESIIGRSLKSVGNVNRNIFMFQKLVIDSDPFVNKIPEENQVGCDGVNEGEYYASQISGGHDVIVTWLIFTVDEIPFHFKTYYQYQLNGGELVSPTALKEAFDLTIQGIAPTIAESLNTAKASADTSGPHAP